MARTKKQTGPICEWTEDTDDGSWDTACGHRFQFTDGGPKENGQQFCGYCGRSLKAKIRANV
jgi:hypothetical protein